MNKPDLSSLLPRGPRTTRRRPGGARPKRVAKVNYEARIRADASLADLDLELAASFFRDTPAGNKPVLDALQDYGLVKGAAPNWKITNAALLLFAGTSARHWNPGAGIRVMRVAGTARIHGHRQSVTWMAYAGPPLASATPEGFRLVAGQVGTSEPLRHIFFRPVPEYPEVAWREILINAVAHREYDGIAETEIVFYDDRVEVTNPGIPLEPFTVDDVTQGNVVAKARNPVLSRIMGDKGLMRGTATGLVRVCKALSSTLLDEPEFSANAGRFTVTLRNKPQFATAGPGWAWVVSRLPVNREQTRILLACPDGFTEDEYVRLNLVPVDEARRHVQQLVDKDIVWPELVDDVDDIVYYLSANLDAQRWFLEDRVPKLQEHFRDRSRLRYRDYRALFETSYPATKRELEDLANEGFLNRAGRGRATHYLPTAALRKSRN